MARVLKPPAPLSFDATRPSVFLAGSIEMGAAEDWQAQVEHRLRDLDVAILNPTGIKLRSLYAVFPLSTRLCGGRG